MTSDSPSPVRQGSLLRVAQLGLVVALAASLAPPATGQCPYDVTVLDYPLNCSIGSVITVGVSINERGAVVGRYKCSIWTSSEAFLWTPNEGFVTLPRPPGVCSSAATDVSDNGVIVGTYGGVCSPDRGFVYENGQYTELLPFSNGIYSWAAAINAAGQVVGARCFRDDVAPYNAFLWHAREGFTDLGVMTGPLSYARDVNDAGAIVGWTGNHVQSVADAFLRDNKGGLTFLGPIPGGLTSEASAINEEAVIAGKGRIPVEGFPSGVSRAFIWKDGAFTLLGTLPGHLRSGAVDVNDIGQAVGTSWTVDGNPNISHAFIWQNGTLTDLNTLVDAAPVLKGAFAIANDGTIVAFTAGTRMAILHPIDPPIGDLDLDCTVGVIDFFQLIAEWGPCAEGTYCPADIDGDGTVGLLDFVILIENWS